MGDTHAVTDALERVERHADREWFAAALKLGELLAFEKERWTTDDLWSAIEDTYPDLCTHDNRAMGAVMRKLKYQNVIRPSTLYVQSTRMSRHQAPIRVWMSRYHKERN